MEQRRYENLADCEACGRYAETVSLGLSWMCQECLAVVLGVLATSIKPVHKAVCRQFCPCFQAQTAVHPSTVMLRAG
jgi:hypothetical protein